MYLDPTEDICTYICPARRSDHSLSSGYCSCRRRISEGIIEAYMRLNISTMEMDRSRATMIGLRLSIVSGSIASTPVHGKALGELFPGDQSESIPVDRYPVGV